MSQFVTKITNHGSNNFDLRYEPAEDVNPLELVGNASLALHHHAMPATYVFNVPVINKK